MQTAPRVLVGYDGSGPAREAVRAAAGMAARSGASLTVLTVRPRAGQRGRGTTGRASGADAARAIAAQGAALARAQGAAGEARVASGAPADVLVEVAARGGFDLIVVGHRAHGGARADRFGSVAKQVAAAAPCPALVVRGRAPAAVTHLLAAVDGSTPAQRAADAAVGLARACGAQVTLLHVLDSAAMAAVAHPEALVRLEVTSRVEGQVALAWARQRCNQAGVPAREVQVAGRGPDVILTQARRCGAQVIALGRSGRPAFLAPVGVSDDVLCRFAGAVLLAGERVRVPMRTPEAGASGSPAGRVA